MNANALTLQRCSDRDLICRIGLLLSRIIWQWTLVEISEAWQRFTIPLSTYSCICWSDAKWLHCLKRDDPRGNRGTKILTTERAHFVRLEVSCGPVVQQDKPENMIVSLANVNRPSLFISLPNERSKLDFKVEFLTESRHPSPIHAKLTFWSMHRCA